MSVIPAVADSRPSTTTKAYTETATASGGGPALQFGERTEWYMGLPRPVEGPGQRRNVLGARVLVLRRELLDRFQRRWHLWLQRRHVGEYRVLHRREVQRRLVHVEALPSSSRRVAPSRSGHPVSGCTSAPPTPRATRSAEARPTKRGAVAHTGPAH